MDAHPQLWIPVDGAIRWGIRAVHDPTLDVQKLPQRSIMSRNKITPTELLAWSVINKATEKEDTTTASTNLEPIDSKWIEIILGKPESARMKEIVQEVKESEDNDLKEALMDELEMLVEQVDNANNLQPLKLWPDLISILQHDSEPSIRKYAAWVMATAIQNNKTAQDDFARNEGLSAVLNSFRLEKGPEIRLKSLLCISASIRQNYSNYQAFIGLGGFELLSNALKDGNNIIAKRILFIITALLNEEGETGTCTANLAKTHGVIDMVLESFSNHDLDADECENSLYFLQALLDSYPDVVNREQILQSIKNLKVLADDEELQKLLSKLKKDLQ
jgi:hypothetical protein